MNFNVRQFRHKLRMLVVVSSGLGILLVTATLGAYLYSSLHEQALSHVQAKVAVLAANSTAALQFQDEQAAREMLQTLAVVPEIEAAGLYLAADNRLLAAYRKSSQSIALPPRPGPARTGDLGSHFQIIQDVVLNQERIGSLVLLYNTRAIRDAMVEQVALAIGIGLLSLGACLLLASRLQNTLNRPITELSRVIGTVAAERQYDIRARKYTDDELGQLTDGINAMLMRIQDQSQQLIEARHQLEDRVRERTAELQQEIEVRKQVEQALDTSRQRYQILTESGPAGIFSTDASGLWSYVNPRLARILGRPETEILGNNWTRAIHPEEARTIQDQWEASLRNARSFDQKFRFLRPEGSTVWVHVQALPERGADHHITGYIGSVTDVTAQKQVEDAQREQAGLKDAVRSMERVLSVVGHELRTPLAAVRATSELLLMHAGRGGDADLVATIRDEISRLIAMVNNMLEAARINSGRARWNWGEVSLQAVCTEAMEVIRPLIDPEKVQIIHRVLPPDLRMRGDSEAIRRVLINIASNAIKHTPQGLISITIRSLIDSGQKWIEIRITDTGQGIPPEIMHRLGKPFSLNQGLVGADYVRGAGLGLAICRGIIEAHGGTLQVTSEPGRGSAFTLRLNPDLEEAIRIDENTSGWLEESEVRS